MPALVNSRVGSLAGSNGDERTRVCPCRSKYSRNFSRISLPVIQNGEFSTANCTIGMGSEWVIIDSSRRAKTDLAEIISRKKSTDELSLRQNFGTSPPQRQESANYIARIADWLFA